MILALVLGPLMGLAGRISAATAPADEGWEQAFRNPPPDCRPEVYWDWMGGLLKPRRNHRGSSSPWPARASAACWSMQMPDQLAGVVQWAFATIPAR